MLRDAQFHSPEEYHSRDRAKRSTACNSWRIHRMRLVARPKPIAIDGAGADGGAKPAAVVSFHNLFCPRNEAKIAPADWPTKVNSYRRAFLEIIGDMHQYTEAYNKIYGGVLSPFVKFSRTKNIKFVYIPIFGGKKKKQENMED